MRSSWLDQHIFNFRDDQFRSEQEQFAFFNKVVPAVVNGGSGAIPSEAAKVLQQARFQQHRNSGNALAYMPGATHSGESWIFFFSLMYSHDSLVIHWRFYQTLSFSKVTERFFWPFDVISFSYRLVEKILLVVNLWKIILKSFGISSAKFITDWLSNFFNWFIQNLPPLIHFYSV